MLLQKIISGGQTGVDRAALDAAILKAIDHGGYCPRGRLAEDGPIPGRYKLIETSTDDPAIRTEANVLSSDGTLVLFRYSLRGGSLLTEQMCIQHLKPLLKIDIIAHQPQREKERFDQWLPDNKISALNIAGPRESEGPVYEDALSLLEFLLS